MEAREQRGLEIAAKCKITQKNGTWLVPSQSGHGKYAVFIDDKPTCTCPDHETRQVKCKHIIAVEYFIKREENPDGTTTVTETISVTKRQTYRQDWTNYNKAQVNEKDQFQMLLHDLCKGLEEPPPRNGSKYRLAVFGRSFFSSGKTFDLPPAHFKKGLINVCHLRLPSFGNVSECSYQRHTIP